MTRIVYMGTSDFAVPALEALSSEFNVVLVVTKEDSQRGRGKKLLPSAVKEKALELDLEVFQPKNINEKESVEYLKSLEADYFVVASYGQILKEEVLNLPKYYAINIHASILPSLRGAAPINRAIIQGDVRAGVSIMKMEKGLDTGPVAMTLETEINNKNDVDLHDELAHLGAQAVVEVLKSNPKDIIFTAQSEEGVSYADKIEKDTRKIDFASMTSKDIDNLTRGLYSLGGSFFIYEDQEVKVYNLDILTGEYSGEPGEILENKKKIIIKTVDGAIELKEIQFPNKKKMDVKSFLAGNSVEKGLIVS